MTAAIEVLHSKAKGDIIHQGVTTALETPGPTTRTGTRRTSEGAAGPSDVRLGLPSPHRETEEDRDNQETQHAQQPLREPVAGEGWLFTMLTDMQKTLNELVSMVSTINTQLMQERQRTNNLELRVESIQQAHAGAHLPSATDPCHRTLQRKHPSYRRSH